MSINCLPYAFACSGRELAGVKVAKAGLAKLNLFCATHKKHPLCPEEEEEEEEKKHKKKEKKEEEEEEEKKKYTKKEKKEEEEYKKYEKEEEVKKPKCHGHKHC
eukprot:366228-Chlamydomonas_euryale.AAC.1